MNAFVKQGKVSSFLSIFRRAYVSKRKKRGRRKETYNRGAKIVSVKIVINKIIVKIDLKGAYLEKDL